MTEHDISHEAAAIAEQRIHPIVEFFPIDYSCRSLRDFIDVQETDRKLLRTALASTKGLYVFYNSEFEIIYLGKTKSKLWTEMKNAYSRPMAHYSRYAVQYPRGRYKEDAGRTLRPLRRGKRFIYDCAAYFSASSIEDDTLIDVFELMLIRLLPNDLLNVRMEGNTTLRPYVVPGRTKAKDR